MTSTPDLTLPTGKAGAPRRPRTPSALARGRWQTVDDVFFSRRNAIGALRLLFASLVVVSHAGPLGFGDKSPLDEASHGQTDLGNLSVLGFFVLSGFLITRSARGRSIGSYLWARFLRIFPAFWTCLLLTTLVLGPALWWWQNGDLHRYWTADQGPGRYLVQNWTTHIGQFGLAGLMKDVPYGHLAGDTINGSLWTLRYELVCYLAVAALALIGALTQRRKIILLAFVVVVSAAVVNQLPRGRYLAGSTSLPDVRLPLLGWLAPDKLLPLALVFTLGAVAAVYPRRFVLDGRAAMVAAVVFVVSLRLGWFDVVGAPSFAYITLWAATALKGPLTRVGVKRDISYGVYIYAFPIQQFLAMAGLPSVSYVLYLAASLVLAAAAGTASWYAIERPAMTLKSSPPSLRALRRPRRAASA